MNEFFECGSHDHRVLIVIICIQTLALAMLVFPLLWVWSEGSKRKAANVDIVTIRRLDRLERSGQ